MDERSARNLELVGGRLCLEYANTISTRIEGLGKDYLTTYDDLLAWSRHAGALTPDEAAQAAQAAASRPDLAAATLARAISLRELLYRIFLAVVSGNSPAEADLAALNAELQQAMSRLEIVPQAERFVWAWSGPYGGLDQMLGPIVRSAGELLTSTELERIRQCARVGCDWLFLDLSKNCSRRWCSMGLCGSRVKAGRYYRRKKERHDDLGRISTSTTFPAGAV